MAWSHGFINSVIFSWHIWCYPVALCCNQAWREMFLSAVSQIASCASNVIYFTLTTGVLCATALTMTWKTFKWILNTAQRTWLNFNGRSSFLPHSLINCGGKFYIQDPRHAEVMKTLSEENLSGHHHVAGWFLVKYYLKTKKPLLYCSSKDNPSNLTCLFQQSLKLCSDLLWSMDLSGYATFDVNSTLCSSVLTVFLSFCFFYFIYGAVKWITQYCVVIVQYVVFLYAIYH